MFKTKEKGECCMCGDVTKVVVIGGDYFCVDKCFSLSNLAEAMDYDDCED